jgi:arylsulfatase A-like enzyme
MRFVVAALTAVLASSGAWAKPNLIVILTDDQNGTGSISHMPKVLSLLADQGVTFTNSFVNNPLCAPSRASFLTGQATHNHGITSNEEGWHRFKSLEGNALPVWLQAAGYRTAFLGKYMNRYGEIEPSTPSWIQALAQRFGWSFASDVTPRVDVDPRTWVPSGWDLWFAFAKTTYYGSTINENGKLVGADAYSTDVLRDRAVGFIQEQSQTTTPLFMLIATKAVHQPWTPARKYEHAFAGVEFPMSPAFNEQDVSQKPQMIRKRPTLDKMKIEELQNGYRRMLQTLLSVDDLVDAVIGALQNTGKLNNTIIIYTSDNGFSFGDHRLVGKGVPYDSSIRVPLVMRGPGIPKNETRSQLVNNLDVVATIEQLAELTPGIAPDGRSLSPLFENSAASWRSAILVETFSSKLAAVRTATRKYVKYKEFEELYDLTVDPHELQNRAKATEYATDLTSLRASLDRLRRCSGSSCWAP